MQKPKLLTLGHSYVVALNRSVMRELQRRGNIDVEVIAPRFFKGDLRPIHIEPEPENSFLKIHPIDCYLSHKIHFFFYNQRQLKKIISQNQFDYFYLWEEPYIVSGYQVADLLKNRKFSIYSNQNIHKKYPWPFSFFEETSINHCDSFWGCGPLVEETFRKKGFIDLNYETVPYFVNTERFKSFNNEEKINSKKNLGLDPQKFLIGFMGRLTEEKGLPLIQKILEKLPTNLKYQLLVLGSGSYEKKLKEWIAQNKRNEVFMKFAKHEEVPDILPAMDMLLCPSQTRPSWREQFGRMIVEAFASGVPVVASRSGEIPYVVGEAGVLLSETNVTEWVETITHLMANKNLLVSMKEKGLQRAQIFSLFSVAEQIETIVLKRLQKS